MYCPHPINLPYKALTQQTCKSLYSIQGQHFNSIDTFSNETLAILSRGFIKSPSITKSFFPGLCRINNLYKFK